jgi:hypothetical protein
MPSRLLPLSLLATLALTSATFGQQPKLTERTYTRLRDTVLPSKEEERWRNVDWKSSFWEAVVEAQKAEKPILLWAMNGHPLGHT